MAGAIYLWASTGLGQDSIKLFIGCLTIPAIYLSTIWTAIAGVAYLGDSWERFQNEYESYRESQ